MSNISKKIICVVGTTASGKTKMAVKLAFKFGGEIISADSRQVYKYMDVGSGKDLGEYKIQIPSAKSQIKSKSQAPNPKLVTIPYHCIDLVDPKTDFSLAKWLKAAKRAIKDVQGRGRLPIVVGGTHLYVQALVDGYELSEGKPDAALRGHLERLSAKQLFARLLALNPIYAKCLNASERGNKQRLIRRFEILTRSTQHATRNKKDNRQPFDPAPFGYAKDGQDRQATDNCSEYLVLGLTWPVEALKKRIKKRLIGRLENEDMIGEVKRLHSRHGVSWKRLEFFGLEYKYLSLYLRGRMDKDTLICELARATHQFSRRQMSWLRRWARGGREIKWVKDDKEAFRLVRGFLGARARHRFNE